MNAHSFMGYILIFIILRELRGKIKPILNYPLFMVS